MQEHAPLASGLTPRPRRRGRPRKHDAAYGNAARASVNVRNMINWDYARRGAEALGLQVIGNGPRPIADGPPELRPVTGTTVLTEIGRCLEAIGVSRTVELARHVADVAGNSGLDANATAKLVRRLRTTLDEVDTTLGSDRPMRNTPAPTPALSGGEADYGRLAS